MRAPRRADGRSAGRRRARRRLSRPARGSGARAFTRVARRPGDNAGLTRFAPAGDHSTRWCRRLQAITTRSTSSALAADPRLRAMLRPAARWSTCRRHPALDGTGRRQPTRRARRAEQPDDQPRARARATRCCARQWSAGLRRDRLACAGSAAKLLRRGPGRPIAQVTALQSTLSPDGVAESIVWMLGQPR